MNETHSTNHVLVRASNIARHMFRNRQAIPVGNTGLFAIVDQTDYDAVCHIRWTPLNTDSGVYVRAYVNGKRVCLHRHLLNAQPGEIVDHANWDTLDHTRENLRIANGTQSNANRRKQSGTTSRYLGVDWNTKSRKWYARVGAGGKRRYLGMFVNEADAARAYDRAALELFGEYANLNFPEA